MFRNGLFGPLPAWHAEIVPGDWVIHILNAHHGPIGYLPEVLADYRIHPQGLWSSKSVAQRHADVLRMLSKVDWHFHGRYTSLIDDYRIGIVMYLANSLEMASSHAASLEPSEEYAATDGLSGSPSGRGAGRNGVSNVGY